MNLSAILTVAALFGTHEPSEGFEGTWGGWAEFGGDVAWVQVRVEQDALFIDDVSVDLHGAPASSFEVAGSQVRFTYTAEGEELSFDGTAEGRTLSGEVASGAAALGAFELTRFHDVPTEQLARHLGRYATEAGEVLWVVPRTYGGVRLVRHEGEGQRFGDWSFDAWLPLEDDVYFEARLGGPQLPPERVLAFEGDTLHLVGEDVLEARRTPDGSVRLAVLASGELSLHGWLLTPPGSTAHPAIAYAHGSGYVAADSSFDLYTSMRLVRELGLAVLRWDKRGVGRSGGDQAVSDYHELADDVLAAVAWLGEQPHLDGERIGIGGLSQAPSAPLPIAAAESDDVAFVIATSGFVGTPLETNLFNWSNRMRREGRAEEEIAGMVEFFEGMLPYTLDPTPAGQRAYDAYLDRHRAAPWFEAAHSVAKLDDPLDSPALDRWRRIWDVDAAEYWARVTCPVYQSWGAEDPLVDAAACSERMAALVAKTGQRNFTTVVYPPPADHAVGSANTPTFFADLAAWFEREGLAARD